MISMVRESGMKFGLNKDSLLLYHVDDDTDDVIALQRAYFDNEILRLTLADLVSLRLVLAPSQPCGWWQMDPVGFITVVITTC